MIKPADAQEDTGTLSILAAFQGKRAWQLCIIGSAVTLLFVIRYFQLSLQEMHESGQVAYENDFRVFWAAGKLALENRVLDVFDNATLNSVHNVDPTAWMPWLYPPGFLLLVTPLGTMSFGTSWILFSLISVAAVAFALRPFTFPSVPLLILCVLAPAFVTALVNGQNSLLWVAGFTAAMWALKTERPIIAGIFIGMLTLKPQLGLLIPIALVAIGAWRTILAATVTTVLISALPTMLYGWEYWVDLAENMSLHSDKVQQNLDSLPHLVSVFSLFSTLGMEIETALTAQWISAAISAVLVFVTWRLATVSLDLKCAMLLAATMISVPYLWLYEAALFVPLGLFMLRGGALNFNIPGIIFMFALWIGAFPIIVGFYSGIADHLTARNSVLPIVAASLLLIIVATLKSRRSPS